MNLEDISTSVDFLEINQLLEELFDEEFLQKYSYDTNFITRRTSQLSGRMFLLLNTLELSNYPKNSLQDQCLWLEEHFGIHLKKQSLDERYNTHSVTFLKGCFEKVLSQWFIKDKSQGLTTTFNRILLRDSSTWQLPTSLSNFYPSKDASKTGASIKTVRRCDRLLCKLS